MGTPVIGELIAHVSFWLLLAYGWFPQENRLLGIIIFVFLWAAGFCRLTLAPSGAALFPFYVAVLAIGLVLMISRVT